MVTNESPTLRRALVLINPHARNGRLDVGPIFDRFRRGGVEPFSPSVRPDGDIADLIAEFGADCDLVVAGGGDGTINGMIDAIVKLGKPLGVLPLGTANDLARTLGLPDRIEDCVEVILSGRTKRIDLGEVNGKQFLNVASLGVSTEVARQLDRDLKARLGVVGYAIGLWRAVARRRVIKAELTLDGRRMKAKAIQISIGNGRFYGGGMIIAEDAAIDDGYLDLVIVAQQPFWQLILRMLMFRWGKHAANDRVRHYRPRRIDLATRSALPINTDGEVTTTTPAVFRLHPKCLEIFAP